jgi:hypothetical protein
VFLTLLLLFFLKRRRNGLEKPVYSWETTIQGGRSRASFGIAALGHGYSQRELRLRAAKEDEEDDNL